MVLIKWLSVLCIVFNTDFSQGSFIIKSSFTMEDIIVGKVSSRLQAVSVIDCSER